MRHLPFRLDLGRRWSRSSHGRRSREQCRPNGGHTMPPHASPDELDLGGWAHASCLSVPPPRYLFSSRHVELTPSPLPPRTPPLSRVPPTRPLLSVPFRPTGRTRRRAAHA